MKLINILKEERIGRSSNIFIQFRNYYDNFHDTALTELDSIRFEKKSKLSHEKFIEIEGDLDRLKRQIYDLVSKIQENK